MKYCKKPVVIEAIKISAKNLQEVINFSQGSISENNGKLICKTLEGDMIVRADDYLIKGVKGEFYPCRADIFEETYEKVEK